MKKKCVKMASKENNEDFSVKIKRMMSLLGSNPISIQMNSLKGWVTRFEVCKKRKLIAILVT